MHDKLKMAEYLAENESNLTIAERQFIFQCRTNYINVKANQKWKYSETHCTVCGNRSEAWEGPSGPWPNMTENSS